MNTKTKIKLYRMTNSLPEYTNHKHDASMATFKEAIGNKDVVILSFETRGKYYDVVEAESHSSFGKGNAWVNVICFRDNTNKTVTEYFVEGLEDYQDVIVRARKHAYDIIFVKLDSSDHKQIPVEFFSATLSPYVGGKDRIRSIKPPKS